jgi:tRNA1(Val) A37 N6-methylase TrmN6
VTAAPAIFAANELGHGIAHRVLMNPPFHDPVTQPPSPSPERRLAHAAGSSVVALWAQTALRLLRPDGVLTMIYPAERIADVLAALRKGFGGFAILPIYAKPGAPAIRILVRAIKGSRAPLVIEPPLELNDDNGRPTAEAEAILRGGAALSLADS